MKKQGFVKVMNDVIGPSWKGGNIQVAEVILDTFEPLVGDQLTNDTRFVDFLIDSLQLIKQEMLEKKL